MQANQTEAPAAFTADVVLNAYDALPAELRPLYAHIHCGSAAILAALGLTAEGNEMLEAAVEAVPDLADEAEAFDRDKAAEDGALIGLLHALAEACADSKNPLLVSLDAFWGAIAASPVVTGADPNDEEAPLEHYLYDNTDLAGLVGAYWDLQGVLELIFGGPVRDSDFKGSLIELTTDAVTTADLNKSLRLLSSQSRACFAWAHNKIVSMLRAVTNDDLKTLEKKLEASGIRPHFIPAVLEQVKASRVSAEVLSADARRFSPFERSLDGVHEQFWSLQRAVSQTDDHPVRFTFALLLSALAAMLDCRPEDIDARTSTRIEGLAELDAAHFGLALHLAALVSGVELVDSKDEVLDVARSFDAACGGAETRCALCIPLTFAANAVLAYTNDKPAMDALYARLGLTQGGAEDLAPSLEALNDFLVLHAPSESEQPIIQKLFAQTSSQNYDAGEASERYAALLINTLQKMDEENRGILTQNIVTMGFVLGAILSKTPDEIVRIYEDAFPDLPAVNPLILLSMNVQHAAQQLAIRCTEAMEAAHA